ncbi:MAG: peptidoglycan DD-metalloendopeptidase family protein [Mollicutes bacterium]|nr:peptidoglycan DD-metalloendopeptidase family protein [Mollicutes bacterium]
MDENNNKSLGQKVTETMAKAKKIKKLWTYISTASGVGSILVPVFLGIISVFIILTPMIAVYEKIDNLKHEAASFWEKTVNLFKFKGFRSNEEVQNIEREEFIEELEDVYNEYYYDKNVKLDMPLLTSTLFYGKYIPIEDVDEGCASYRQNESGDFVCLDENNREIKGNKAINYKQMKKDVSILAKYMVRKVEVVYCVFETEVPSEDGGDPQIDREVVPSENNSDCPEGASKEIEIRYYLDTNQYKQFLKEKNGWGEYNFEQKLRDIGADVPDDPVDKNLFLDKKIEEIDQIKETFNYLILGIGIGTDPCYGYISGGKAENVDLDDSMFQNIEVQLMQAQSPTASLSSDIPQTIYHSGPIPMSEYLAGVVHAEMGASAPDEAIKAQIIAAKSYAIARAISRDRLIYEDGKYILQIRNSSLDQNYCPLNQKCTHNTFEIRNGQYVYFNKEPLSYDQQERLRKLVNEVENEYLATYGINEDVVIAHASYLSDTDKKDVMSQKMAREWANANLNYKEILARSYSYMLLDISSMTVNVSVNVCSENIWEFNGDFDEVFVMAPVESVKGITSYPASCRCHPSQKKYKTHTGVDLAINYNTPITPIADGVIAEPPIIANRGSNKCGGSIIKIKHTTSTGEVYYSRYVHLNSNSNNILAKLRVGDTVTKNTVIGYVGGLPTDNDSYSCSTGTHLHFELYNSKNQVINPIPTLENFSAGIETIVNDVIVACDVSKNGKSC